MNRIKFNRPMPVNPLSTILDEFLNKGMNELSKNVCAFNKPSVNIKENDDAFIVELAAPGLTKEDFEISIDKDQLVIKVAQANEEKEEEVNENDTYRRREFNYGSFTRSFHLPKTINTDEIKATYNNGILSLSLNKKEEAKEKEPRTIAIS